MSINTLNNILNIIGWIFYMLSVPRMLHIVQQESYQNDGMFRWITKNPKKAFLSTAKIFGIVLLSFLLSGAILILITKNVQLEIAKEYYFKFSPAFVAFITYCICSIVLFIKDHKERKEAKKPLKYTARAKRLFVYNFFVLVILQALLNQTISSFYPNEIQQNMNVRYQQVRANALFGEDQELVDRIAQYFNDGNKENLQEKDFEVIEKYNQIVEDYNSALLYDLEQQLTYMAVILAFLTFSLPLNMIIANWFAGPLEGKINENYMRKAYKKLQEKDYKNLIKIGITGSYGKTSTKFILKTILEEKYNVLATPGSYNTSMGNVRVIREQLQPEHEVFISEMGARKKRDIKEICEFVEPQIGIITSIGEQHLETFKTIDNVAKTKGELLNGVLNKKNTNYFSPYASAFKNAASILKAAKKNAEESEDGLKSILEDGAVFLNKDGGKCEELYKNDSHDKKFLFSAEDQTADVYAKGITTSLEGSEFVVVSKRLGEYKCKTKLLGVHNVQNIIGAIAIAEYLGLSKEQIQNGVSKIEPVEHRLQLLPTTNGTTVIDDAFNSNPAGSKAALDVIKQFKGRKIIITPGMVELGEKEAELNKEFGKQIAEAVDIAILVGPRHTMPIQEGLKEKKFDDMSIYVVGSLDEATQKLGKIAKSGDVILFENDLPDSYNE